MSKSWIAVACAEHVRRGVALGIMQVSHGKAAPLRRLAPGDRVAYYSPAESLGGRDGLQCFTAIGIVLDGDIRQADMGGGFHPFRRNVRYLKADPAPIRPLLDRPDFALTGKGWGARLRFGLLQIDDSSMDAIAEAMAATGAPSAQRRSRALSGS
jgi:EVE domain-containing protein